MIGSIAFRKGIKLDEIRHKNPPGAWAWNLPAISARGGRIEFKPGLNILFGPNGCGKSTVVEALAAHMMALHDGVTALTRDSLQPIASAQVLARDGKKPRPVVAADVIHDGTPVVYGAAGKLGHALGIDLSFFEDFTEEDGFRSGSQGSRTLAQNNAAFRILTGRREMPTGVATSSEMRPDRINEVWLRARDTALAHLEPRLERGQPTIILDEPDAHLSLLMQSKLWRDVIGSAEAAETFQIIVATHSPFALGAAHANVIGLPDEYVAACRSAMRDLGDALSAAPRPKP